MIIAVKKQENKITEGLRTIFTFHERSRSHATYTISLRGIPRWWKVEKPFLFSGNMAQLMNLWGY